MILLGLLAIVNAAAPYYGTKIGSFQTHAHDVVGDVYAVDDRTVYIKGFSYDGEGPGKWRMFIHSLGCKGVYLLVLKIHTYL